MRLLSITSLLFLALSFAKTSQALVFDMNTFYFSDSLAPGSTAIENSRLALDVALSLDLNKSGKYTLGWSFTMLNYSLSNSTTTEASSVNHGPRFTWYIDKSMNWSMAFTYNLFAKTSFNDGSAEVDWRGNSYKIDFGYSGFVTNRFAIGVRLNYYAASYDEQFDASNSFSEISTSQSQIYPSISMMYILN